MPKQNGGLSPLELLSGQIEPSYDHFRCLHTCMAPCYVLDPKLQDAKKIPKWNRRSRLGQYLGPSESHSSTVGRVLNLNTGNISPQYHVVHDDRFTTVANPGVDNEDTLQKVWLELIKLGHEKYFDPDDMIDSNGKIIPPPPLHDTWLTPKERHKRRQNRTRHVVEGSGDSNETTHVLDKEDKAVLPPDIIPKVSFDDNGVAGVVPDGESDDGFGRFLRPGE